VYLARFGGDELAPARARAEASAAVGLREAAIARMFAVPFELASLGEE
jgi:hypothetical protein